MVQSTGSREPSKGSEPTWTARADTTHRSTTGTRRGQSPPADPVVSAHGTMDRPDSGFAGPTPQRRTARVTITNQPAESDSAVGVVEETGETCQLVDYAEPVHRDIVNSLAEGSTVEVTMEHVVARGNCWRVLGVHARARPE